MGGCLWGFASFLSSRRPREPRSEAGQDMKRKRTRGGQGRPCWVQSLGRPGTVLRRSARAGWILFRRLSRLLNRWT